MAVSFVNIGAKGSGTTTASLAHPASTAANQILVAGRCAWEPTLTFSNETGWTAAGEDVSTGTGTAANAHLTGIRADTKQLTGSDAGPTVFDFGGAGLTGSIGCILSFSKASGTTWDIANTTGDDTSHGTNRSITGVGNIALAPGDYVVVFAAVDTDSSLTITSPAITASGITFGTTTRHTSGAGNGAGDNGNIEAFSASVSSGTGTVAPALAFTTSTSQCGGAVFVRLREVSAGGSGSASGSITWAGSASGTRVSSGAVSGSVSWAGSSTGVRVPQASASGAITWAGSATGEAPVVVMEGSASGAITWAGVANGTTLRTGASTGSISWAGSATGAVVHRGEGSGAVAWIGNAAGTTTRSGAASGNITWAGSATGAAPGVGPREGAATGAITWAGTATGAVPRRGVGTGTITWVGTALGVSVHNGTATGTITWTGTAEGEHTQHTFWTKDPVAFTNAEVPASGGSPLYTPLPVGYVPLDPGG